jgi:hypothetical protein
MDEGRLLHLPFFRGASSQNSITLCEASATKLIPIGPSLFDAESYLPDISVNNFLREEGAMEAVANRAFLQSLDKRPSLACTCNFCKESATMQLRSLFPLLQNCTFLKW